MLFQTLLQGKLFLIFLFFGIVIGVFYECCYLIQNVFKNRVIDFFLDLFYGIVIGVLFIFITNLFNYGEFRFYLLLAYILGFIIMRKTVGYLVRKMIKFLCNKLKQLVLYLKSNKFIAKIFK